MLINKDNSKVDRVSKVIFNNCTRSLSIEQWRGNTKIRYQYDLLVL